MLALAIVTLGSVVWVMHTDSGRSWTARYVEDVVTRAFDGRGALALGRIESLTPSALTVRNIQLLDSTGRAVVQVDSATGGLSLGALLDGVIRLTSLRVYGATLDLQQVGDTPFDIVWIVQGDRTRRDTTPRAPRLGDDVRVDTLQLADVSLTVTYPWAPHAVFTGVERDSVIAVRDRLHELVRDAAGLRERRRMEISRLQAQDARLIAPGNGPAGLQLVSAHGVLSDPALTITDVRGALEWSSDSLMFDADRVQLPASELAATGVLLWDADGPVRYEATVAAPRVSLRELQWVWPVLPDSGTLSARLMLSTRADADVMVVRMDSIDAQAMASRIRGAATLVVEPRDLRVRDADLSADPITTTLMARLAEVDIPERFAGAVSGTLRITDGGAVTALPVDRADIRYRLRGQDQVAVSFDGGGTVVTGAALGVQRARIASLRAELSAMGTLLDFLPLPRSGIVSLKGDVTELSLTRADVPRVAATMTRDGDTALDMQLQVAARAGRRGWRDPRATTLNAQLDVRRIVPSAFMVDDSVWVGPLRMQGAATFSGTLSQLSVDASMATDAVSAGALTARGVVGVREVSSDSVAWEGALDIGATDVDAATWGPRLPLPETQLRATLAVRGAGIGATVRNASVIGSVAQNASPSLTPLSAHLAAAWDSAALRVDSLRASLPGVRVELEGALARDSLQRETFRGSVRMDSLHVVRDELPRLARALASVDSAVATRLRAFAQDSVRGDVNVSVYGEGSLARYLLSVAVAGNRVRVGNLSAGRVFGSVRANGLPSAARFVAAATADSVDGLAALHIASTNFRIDNASPEQGALRFDLVARDSSVIRARGSYARGADTLLVRADTVRFSYGSVRWSNLDPFVFRQRPQQLEIDPFRFVSSNGGQVTVRARIPDTDSIRANVSVDRFPVGEAAAFVLGSGRYSALLSGTVELAGTREDPTFRVDMRADSVGIPSAQVNNIAFSARYAAQQLEGDVALQDAGGRSVRGTLRLPADLRLRPVLGDRFYTDVVDGEIMADSVRLADLPVQVPDIRDVGGTLWGRLDLGGTFDRPSVEGTLELNGGTLYSQTLGIRPTDARVLFRSAGDSLTIPVFRFRSGPRVSDTAYVTAAVRRPLRDNPDVQLRAAFNNVQVLQQRGGTAASLSGRMALSGPLRRPQLTAAVNIPRATVVLAAASDRTPLNLGTAEAQALLSPQERDVVTGVSAGTLPLGAYVDARDVRLRLGDDVWVRTREAAVKLEGEVAVREVERQRLSLEGEVQAARGVYRLDLGVVNRPFTVDSGRVRFFPQDTLNPSLDIHAQHIVRGVDGRDAAIDIAIGGTLAQPTLRLSSQEDALARAPESELISLLVFGAPTFALDGQRQQTVRTVTSVLAPSLSGAMEGTLQRVLPVFNTVQVSSGGGGDEGIGVMSLLSNVSVTAGKQIGTRTFLRLETGVCRSTASALEAQSLNLWYGVAAEYRLARGLTGQVGVDPGPSPCGALVGMTVRRMQVGLDLFKEWVF